VAVLEPRAGYLLPGPCVAALLDSARREGAEIRTEEARAWRGDGAEARVETSAGEYRTRSLVLAAGAWMSSLLTDLRLPLTVERVLQLSFAPARPEECTPAALPVFVWEYEPGGFWYGFPAIDGAVKVGLHGGQPVAGPDAASREVTEADGEGARGLVRKHLPAADGTLVEANICFYTRTPDGHFIIDRHPDHDRVVMVSACSGHGFKFAPVIGEIVADLLTGNAGAFDLRPFSLARLGR
jgi:sarcosine oxidase